MGRECGSGGDEMGMKPAWLQGLMAETFFATCGAHEDRRKNEKNIFCLDCCRSFCPHCLPSHRSHPLLQVRRYVYQDVVRLDDLEKLIDCSYIQPYTINSAKVIFLNQRAQSRSCKGPANACFTCDRILQEPFHFCSISCKVDHMVYQGDDLSSILCQFSESDFTFSQLDGLRMDGSEMDDSHINQNYPLHFSSCSNTGLGGSGISQEPEVVRKHKKKGSGSFFPGLVFSLGSRRKGAPQRSPLS
ncbi:hypothetical protein RJ640_000312 [Escallonia rubra]|uniref:B box-type domain-containing protein n=1 Tax=Escallonia rubra TaxID=112253 RepID=A0AA88RSK9_9ASTE|nr:hypothetical protein RJ640_000312 [Escallonia rubra]